MFLHESQILLVFFYMGKEENKAENYLENKVSLRSVRRVIFQQVLQKTDALPHYQFYIFVR